MVKLYNKQK